MKWSIKKAKRFLLKVILYCFVGSIVWVLLYAVLPVPLTPLMVIRCAEQISEGEKPGIYKDWVSYNNISPNLPIAAVAAEDQRFTEHFGFDIESMKKAYKSNKRGKKIRGGSTISQQVAKNAFLWPSRTYLRKGMEAYFTVLIELFWTKKRIMTVYLNIIEMGNGVYGCEAASQYYFKKDAKDLSREQAAGIAAILPCPLKYSPMDGGYVGRRRSWILRQMRNLGGELNYNEPITTDDKK
ncbi:MAG: monofunctional biosynthetic peptidoglycan transglycosylase [Chitinophagales bacterium]|nr:monofunctional biosynthetic peptidoglycan transglycosylase [Chitinophagales bacterium]